MKGHQTGLSAVREAAIDGGLIDSGENDDVLVTRVCRALLGENPFEDEEQEKAFVERQEELKKAADAAKKEAEGGDNKEPVNF